MKTNVAESETILEEAQRLVGGDRNDTYAHPLDTWACVADLWRTLIIRRYGVDVALTPDFCCLMMAAMKLAREAKKPKRDNRVDGVGYLECENMCIEEEAKRAGFRK